MHRSVTASAEVVSTPGRTVIDVEAKLSDELSQLLSVLHPTHGHPLEPLEMTVLRKVLDLGQAVKKSREAKNRPKRRFGACLAPRRR